MHVFIEKKKEKLSQNYPRKPTISRALGLKWDLVRLALPCQDVISLVHDLVKAPGFSPEQSYHSNI